MTSPRLAAYFLCAGLGTRLQPLTHRIPKPLIPFLGKSALEHNLEKVRSLNPKFLLANTHHLAGTVSTEAQRLGLEVIHEPEILGAGGCLSHAEKKLDPYDYVLIHNGDVLHNIDLEAFVKAAIASRAVATLAGVHQAHINTLCHRDNRLLGIRGFMGFEPPPGTSAATYSGIALYRKEFFKYCEPGVHDIKPFWNRALQAGEHIGVVPYENAEWHDFGTPADLWKTALWHAHSKGIHAFQYKNGASGGESFPPETGYSASHSTEIPAGENPPSEPDIAAYTNTLPDSGTQVFNEANASLPPGLKNVLVLEKPEKLTDAPQSNAILGKDFVWKIEAP